MQAVVLVLICVVITATAAQKTKVKKPNSATSNRSAIIKSFTASTSTVELCPFSRWMNRTTLTTDLAERSAESLSYSYVVPVGKIEGSGPTVVWNLDRQPPGTYQAAVSVEDRKGYKAQATLTINAVVSTACDPPPPPCPTITVECPSEVEKGNPITFTANVKGDPILDPLLGDASYEWWASSGRIVKGQTEKKMTLEPAGLPFETITVTVSVGGFDPSCTATQASCTISVKGGR